MDPGVSEMKWRGLPFLGAVFLLYAALFFYNGDKTAAALEKSGLVLAEILPIFLVVILFTALINYFLNPEKIAGYLGRESGLKGWLVALAAGVISHGPIYAWYPMIEDLKKHGLKNGLIAAFFYSRSIKVPLLPIMIDYFGFAFTLILTLYILVASVLQGVLMEILCGPAKDNISCG